MSAALVVDPPPQPAAVTANNRTGHQSRRRHRPRPAPAAGSRRTHVAECTNRQGADGTTPARRPSHQAAPAAPPLRAVSPRQAAEPETVSRDLQSVDQAGRVAAGTSTYERVGGAAFFDTLTRRFYESVRADPVLRPLYPSDEPHFEAARRHLELFLVQHFGGPGTYRAERGEAQLGRRHHRFAIGPEQRDAWIGHMTAAVQAAGLGPLEETQMLSFFTATANHLVNRS